MAYEDFAVDTSGMGFEGGAAAAAPAPQFYAFPENYGNPKNKIYKLSAGADDAIRLKGVDGTIFFEGKGPEAAAKAAEIVQQLGKEFGTQATWILDKQTAGGDWKQVSQDTVGQKKNTAVNSFLNVALPLVGGFFGGVPGAMLASVGNSALQNKNSAQAWKDAAVSGISTYIGGKLGPVVGKAASTVAPNLTRAATSTLGRVLPTVGNTMTTNAAGEFVLGLGRGVSTGLGQGFGGGFGNFIPRGGVKPVARNPTDNTMRPGKDGVDELVVTGENYGVDPSIIGGEIGQLAVNPFTSNTGTTSTQQPTDKPTETPDDGTPTVVVEGIRPTTAPINVAPLVDVATMALLDQQLAELYPDKDKSMLDKAKAWALKNPLQALSLGLTALSGLAGTKSGKGSGTYSNMPGNIGAAGTVASLPSTFTTGTLPPPGSMFTAGSRTPAKMNMTTDEWLRYGMGPEKSFFTATPPATTTTPTTTTTTPTTTTGGGATTGGGTTSATGGNRVANMVSPNPTTFLTANTPQTSDNLALQASLAAPPPKTPEQLAEERARSQAALAAQIQAEKAKLAGGVVVPGMARGGSMRGKASKARKARSEFAVHGAGTGRSDDIPAVLSDGEYVLDAETVAMLGDGSNKAGAEKLDQFRVNLRRHKGANLAKGRISVNAKSPEKYLAGGRVK